jgi:hypothetical protein
MHVHERTRDQLDARPLHACTRACSSQATHEDNQPALFPLLSNHARIVHFPDIIRTQVATTTASDDKDFQHKSGRIFGEAGYCALKKKCTIRGVFLIRDDICKCTTGVVDFNRG